MISSILPAFNRIDAAPVQANGLSLPTGGSAAVAEAGRGFSAAMSEVIQDATRSLRGAETTSIQGIHGQGSTQAVVDAVMGAERTLQTAVALRDKAVSAYLELSRMSI